MTAIVIVQLSDKTFDAANWITPGSVALQVLQQRYKRNKESDCSLSPIGTFSLKMFIFAITYTMLDITPISSILN